MILSSDQGGDSAHLSFKINLLSEEKKRELGLGPECKDIVFKVLQITRKKDPAIVWEKLVGLIN